MDRIGCIPQQAAGLQPSVADCSIPHMQTEKTSLSGRKAYPCFHSATNRAQRNRRESTQNGIFQGSARDLRVYKGHSNLWEQHTSRPHRWKTENSSRSTIPIAGQAPQALLELSLVAEPGKTVNSHRAGDVLGISMAYRGENRSRVSQVDL